jgi:hypothetical protein
MSRRIFAGLIGKKDCDTSLESDWVLIDGYTAEEEKSRIATWPPIPNKPFQSGERGNVVINLLTELGFHNNAKESDIERCTKSDFIDPADQINTLHLCWKDFEAQKAEEDRKNEKLELKAKQRELDIELAQLAAEEGQSLHKYTRTLVSTKFSRFSSDGFCQR